MSEPRRSGVLGVIGDVAEKLIGSLPGQFLVLIVLNILFLVAVLRFVDVETDQKLGVIRAIVDHCLK